MSIAADRLCFVIGPIGAAGSSIRKHADLLLNSVIRQVLEQPEFAYRVKRADEDADPGMIGDKMIIDIINADLVVADLTSLNPNVFYEMGIRHAAKKAIIHLAADETKLPFDNISHRTIFFDLSDWHSAEACRKRLAGSAKAIDMGGFQVSNPVTQANASFRLSESEDPKDRLISRLQHRVEQIEHKINGKDVLLPRVEGGDRTSIPRIKISLPGQQRTFTFHKDRVFGDILELILQQQGLNLLDENYTWSLLVDGEVINRNIKNSNIYYQTFEDLGIEVDSAVALIEKD